MPIASDVQLQTLLGDGLLSPPNPELINPASIDFCIGDTLYIERSPRNRIRQLIDALLSAVGLIAPGAPSPAPFDPSAQTELDISDRTAENPYWLRPGEFVLAATQEILKVPPDMGASLLLKSSRARSGYMHPPTWIDPGWEGIITLEISNSFRHHAIPLHPGLKLGQYVLHRTEVPPIATYRDTGRYHGAITVERSRG